ncbi:hypothetical protein TSOC_010350 [Tetrabaena socialis]|uniref:RAP domain-containing protein n=1 Tax=Tetrabaena socialis TaxID=47790 RepID=A0A2J7ZTI0_9CHLO|nr:hypothetical protein TSOC_010350 [Tetrabaena socialis]|eukprot:PNH03576.1 hypothetical protein TSOC_010350 [Tetrabaena socialis]
MDRAKERLGPSQELLLADRRGELAGITTAGRAAGSQSCLLSTLQCLAAVRRVEADPAISVVRQEVAGALCRLQWQLVAEQRQRGPAPIASVSGGQAVERLAGRADALVELGAGRLVAVEVEGQADFVANDPRKCARCGPIQLRDRQLGRLSGVRNVVSVPYWQWKELRNE